MICLNNIQVNIDNELLFSIPKLIFNEHKVYLLTGKSGSGKTTLLYILGMLSLQYQVDYYWNNEKIDLKNDDMVSKYRKSNIGFLFQENNLMEQLNIIDNFKFYFGLGNENFSHEKMMELLNFVDLKVNVHSSIKKLSGGELQRLAIACVLAKNPQLIICDEPTSSLDETRKEIILDLLSKIAHQYHKTVVIASHDECVEKIADVIYKIENKTIECQETKTHETTDINTPQKISYDFYFNYVSKVLMKNKIMNLVLLVVMGLCLGFGLSKISFSEHFYKRNIIGKEVMNKNELLISNCTCPSKDDQTTFCPDHPIDEEEVAQIKSIEGIEKIYPLYNFVSYGRDGRNNENRLTSTVRYYQNNQFKNEYTYNMGIRSNSTAYVVYPYYQEQDLDSICDIVNKDVQGVYINQTMAEVLGINDTQQVEIELEGMKVPVTSLDVLQKDGRIAAFIGDLEITTKVPVRGILKDRLFYSLYGVFSDSWGYVYMPYKMMDDLLSQVDRESYINEQKLYRQKMGYDTNVEFWTPCGYIAYIKNVEQFDEIKVQIEDINPNFKVGNDYQSLETVINNSREYMISETYLIYIMIAIIVLISGLINYLSIRQRKVEISLMKANGMTKKEVVKMFLIETVIKLLILMIIAYVYNCYVYTFTPYKIIHITTVFSPLNFIYTFVLSLCIILIPTIVSIRQINKLSPNQILRGQF